jgi:hypothetical protein
MCSMRKLYARYHKIFPDKLPDYSVEPELKLNERFHPDFEILVLSKLLNQCLYRLLKNDFASYFVIPTMAEIRDVQFIAESQFPRG